MEERFGARDTAILASLGDQVGEGRDYMALVEGMCTPYLPARFFIDGLLVEKDSQTALNCLVSTLPEFPRELLEIMAEDGWAKGGIQEKPELDFLKVFTNQEIKHFFSYNPEEAWQKFDAKYPRCAGKLSTSPVAYSSDRTQAAIYLSWVCGSMCGRGIYVYLEFRKGNWEVVKKNWVWTS